MKIKFRALCLAMTLVVMAASVASAAATFLGIDKEGSAELITVDPTAAANSKITYKSVDGLGTLPPAKLSNRITGYKFFAFDGGVAAVSADIVTNLGGNDKIILFTVADDGTLSNKTLSIANMASGTKNGTNALNWNGVKGVAKLNDDIVVFSDHVITAVLTDHWKFDEDDSYVSFDVSLDTAFVYNNKLYVIASPDNPANNAPQTLAQVSKIQREDDVSVFSKTRGTLQGEAMVWNTAAASGPFSTVVAGTNVFIGTLTGLYRFPLDETTDTGIILNSTAPTVAKVNSNAYLAMTAVDDTLYAVKSVDVNTISLVTIKDGVETNLYEKVSTDITGQYLAGYVPGSFDIQVNDNVVAISNVGVTTAFYALDESANKWKEIDEKTGVFSAVAAVKTASKTTPDTPVTPTTTVVDASKIATASQDNLVAATPASAISDFVTAEEASTSTVPSGAQAKIEALLKTDDKTTVTLAAKTNYTPAKEGYLLVKKAVDVSKVRVYFVEAATTTAATGDLTAATFLDADCKEMGSTGTSVYAASDKLESGKTYTLVEATVSTSSSGDDGDSSGSTTSSSSGGCDAGFGLWAAAALMAVSTISKRR